MTAQKHHYIRSAKVISGLTFLSRILGLVRDKACAFIFGRGLVWDSFALAFVIPNLFRRLFGEGALSISFIPTFTDYLYNKDSDKAWKLFNITFTLVSLFLISIVVILEIISASFASAYQSIPQVHLTLKILMVLLPFLVLICLVGLCMAALNSLKHFAVPALSPVILNVIFIAGVFLLAPLFGATLEQKIIGVAVAVVIAGVVELALNLWMLKRRGLKLRFAFAPKETGFVQVVKNMAPMLIGLSIFQINVLFDNLIATIFVPGHGAVSSLYYANRLFQFPIALVGISLGVAIYPTLSEMAARKQHAEVLSTTNKALRAVLFLAIPSGIGLIVAGQPMIELFFQGGRFTQYDTFRTYFVLFAYSLGLWASCGNFLVTRLFYSFKDMKTPVRVGVAMVVLNLALNMTFVWFFAEAGLALATSITASMQMFVLMHIITKRIGQIDARSILRSSLKTLGASALMGWLAYMGFYFARYYAFTSLSLLDRIANLVIPLVIGVGMFFALAKLFKLPEMSYILRSRRKSTPPVPPAE